MHRLQSQSCQWMDTFINSYLLRIKNKKFCFWVSAELALPAHLALQLHGRPVKSSPQREESFTDVWVPPFQLAHSGLNEAVQRANALSSSSLSSATKVLMTASVLASLLHGLHALIHHSTGRALPCLWRCWEVQDTDNTSTVYYFYLPSLDVCSSLLSS